MHDFGRTQVLVIAMVALCGTSSFAQVTIPIPTSSQPQSSTLAPKDPHGRETPQSCVLNFTKYAQRGDYETAAKYLQPATAKQVYDPVETSRHLILLINTSFRGSIASLSNKPEGSAADSDDPNTEVAGSLVVGGQAVPFLLVRVFRKDVGPIWLVSGRTLEQVPELYQRAGSPRLAEYFPDAIKKKTLMGIPLGQWLAWLLSIPFSLLTGWLVVSLGNWLSRLRKAAGARRDERHPLAEPIMFVIAILIDARLVLLVGMPIFYRVYYFRITKILLTVAGAWLCMRIADQMFEHVHRDKLQRLTQSILQLLYRFNNVVIFTIAFLLVVAILGFDTKTMLAGLGVGGIALALAAQKTLENLIGGITLVMDETASVGDDCIISGRAVTVREIGLRSIRFLTQEGTEISYPNGMLSQTFIENVSRRGRFLISAPFFLSFTCSLAQLQLLIARVREILYSHPRLEPDTAKFRLSGLTTTGFQIDLFAYVRTNDGAEFAAIQEDILFRIVDIIESIGTVWAPSHVTYLSKDLGVSDEKVHEAARMVSTWQEANQVPFPDFSPEHIAAVRGTLDYPPERSVLRNRSNTS